MIDLFLCIRHGIQLFSACCVAGIDGPSLASSKENNFDISSASDQDVCFLPLHRGIVFRPWTQLLAFSLISLGRFERT